MIRYENVLLATDFSVTASDAAKHALSLARTHGADLHIVHVVEEFSYWESFDLRHFPSKDVYEELKRNAAIALENQFPEKDREGVPIRVWVRHGKPFVEIIRVAKECEADVIVLGSHGLSGLAETLFGSTADKVVHKAPCAVLVVRHPDHEFEMP